MSVNNFFSLGHLQGLTLNRILQLSPARKKKKTKCLSGNGEQN